MNAITRWINRVLCFIGLHGWEYIHRTYFYDAAHWRMFNILPPDEFYCLHCKKRKFTTGNLS